MYVPEPWSSQKAMDYMHVPNFLKINILSLNKNSVETLFKQLNSLVCQRINERNPRSICFVLNKYRVILGDAVSEHSNQRRDSCELKTSLKFFLYQLQLINIIGRIGSQLNLLLFMCEHVEKKYNVSTHVYGLVGRLCNLAIQPKICYSQLSHP